MSKLTLFFIIATVLIVSITGTLLGYKYFTAENEITEKPLYVAIDEEIEKDEEVLAVIPEPETTPSEPPPSIPNPFAMNEPGNDDEEIELKEILAEIDEEKIILAGFKDNVLKIEEFDGFVFNDFNMAEYNDDDHILYILLFGEEESAKITELIFPSNEISDEVYASLKAKMEQSGYFDVNETDQYGDHSYFANHDTEKNAVFLVVKIRERLYTLHYPAKNHNKIKNLINQL